MNLEFRIKKSCLSVLAFCILNSPFSILYAQGEQITQGGSAYAISSPYAAEDLFEIQYCQSANVMYLAHIDYPLMILSRTGDTQWTLEEVDLGKGVFQQENIDESRTITPSAVWGDITLTASSDTFYPSHVGGLFKLIHPVDANVVSDTIDRNDSTHVSSSVTVDRNQRFSVRTTGIAWKGNLMIQRSYDDGATWRDVFPFRSSGNDNINYIDTETIDEAEYRIRVTNYSAPAPWDPPKSWDKECSYKITAHAYEREGIVEITGVSTAREADATVTFKLGGTSATYKWAEGSFSGYSGYPATVCFHHERLVLGGTSAEPDTIWFSQTDDWHNFLVDNLDTSAVSFTLAADQVNAIRWLSSHNDLMIGTSGGEWKMETPPGKPIAASTLKRQSTYGSAPIQSLVINNRIVYVQRNAQKILRMNYWYEADNWNSHDLTLLSEHITRDGIVEMAYQRVPYSILYSVCENGDLLALVMEDNQEVLGWSRYVFDGDCESVAVVPGDNEDQVWIIVARQLNGLTKRCIEQFMPIEFADQDSAYYVDCGLTFDGGDGVTVINVTQADPAVVTTSGHTFTDGIQVRFTDIEGMTDLNDGVYTVSTVSGASFELRDRTDAVDISSVGFTTYTSGGSIEQVENTFTNFSHLESESVIAAGDGGYAGSYTVSNSTVTLDDYYNRAHIGLPYTAKLKPMKLDFLATGGALQGRTKRISATTLRFYETLSCSIGPNWTDYDSFAFRDAGDLLETATPLFSGDKYLNFPGGFETAGDICLQDSMPVPLTVLGIIVEYEVER